MKKKKLSLNKLKIESFITTDVLRQLHAGNSIADRRSDSDCPKNHSDQSFCSCDSCVSCTCHTEFICTNNISDCYSIQPCDGQPY
ncbi:pinensin family lanthipeptide [Fulvivirga imtechensis]|uniref:pinensin family lanthipeptide n=1 Tax=Fulvivirga imtechensis TaxID=881893 RepID=UPI001C87ECEA